MRAIGPILLVDRHVVGDDPQEVPVLQCAGLKPELLADFPQSDLSEELVILGDDCALRQRLAANDTVQK